MQTLKFDKIEYIQKRLPQTKTLQYYQKMCLVTDFHHERRQDLSHLESVHVQDDASIDLSLCAKPGTNQTFRA